MTARAPGPSDEQLLRMIHEMDDQARVEADAVEDEVAAEPERVGDACPNCGEPAEALAECRVCREPGCLPPDLWTPGQQDPCLTLCVRCARDLHLACAAEDEAGNPRCPTCAF